MNTPKWAQNLTLDAILYIQSATSLKPELPDIKWRKSHSKSSSGARYKTHINICAGLDRTDSKLVLLHELAHWARPFGNHHSPEFWDLAWQLYRQFKLPIRYCKNREENYLKGSVKAYHRSLKG